MRPVRSTLSRRVRGVLSPYRERGIAALARPNGGGIPAYAGMTVMGMGGAAEGSQPFFPRNSKAMRI